MCTFVYFSMSGNKIFSPILTKIGVSEWIQKVLPDTEFLFAFIKELKSSVTDQYL
jgi:hypothetical protein